MIFTNKTDFYIERLKGKPVYIYGMGNGAEKIIAYLHENGIDYTDVFASDEFVRGHSFLGRRVKSLSEVESECENPYIVTAFALEGEKCELFFSLAKRHTVFSPNLPPYGDGCMDFEWINNNKEKIERVRNLLDDEDSVKVFDSLIKYNITANINDLFFCPDEVNGFFEGTSAHADIGAYDGDTVNEFLSRHKNCSQIYAFEPSYKTFGKLCKNVPAASNVICVNAAVGEQDGEVLFENTKGRGSSVSTSGKPIKQVSIDSFFRDIPISSIKIDGEGQEMQILRGGVNTICNSSPDLCTAVYHRAYDLIDIPLWLHRQNPSYKFYLRNKKYIPSFDVFLYCKKK